VDGWLSRLNGDPLPWLLEKDDPAVRHLALRDLLGGSEDDHEVSGARRAAMATDPIAAILAARDPVGFWVKPGPGYSPKYTGTVWQLIFLDQLGADGHDERVRVACEYLFSHTQAACGGFGASYESDGGRPPARSVIHCLNGNLLRSLLGFGWLEDERVQRAIDWQARSITGEDFDGYYQSGTSGPGFCCAANYRQPCAWGAVKAALALARIPEGRRTPQVERALEVSREFLLSRDPAKADYPMGESTKPNGSWFKLAFPLGYVADVLQTLEALCALDLAKDPRLQPALAWLLSKQDNQGRWPNQYAYSGKLWQDIDQQGQPSKWVTLRAARVLRAAFG
jgi:hypothetical protein